MGFNMTVGDVISELYLFANARRKKINEWFFKTGPGEYGEGDQFIGVCMPDLRNVAKKFEEIEFVELQKLVESRIHEERLCALVIAVYKFETANKINKKTTTEKEILSKKNQAREIYKWYISNTQWINNWDLVDVSCHKIVGGFLLQNPNEIDLLRRLSDSKNMWERRISIVSTWMFIREGELAMTLELAEKLLGNTEDLMHKSVGWMLREAWKKDEERIEAFLIKHYINLPRTTLRYAIERIEEGKRKRFLNGEF